MVVIIWLVSITGTVTPRVVLWDRAPVLFYAISALDPNFNHLVGKMLDVETILA